MTAKQIHHVSVVASRSTDIDGSLIDAIAELQSVLQSIPEEYRSTAYICMETGQHDYSDSYYSVQIIRYTRPENEAEAAERIKKEQIRNSRQEIQDRALYERLAARFGDPK